MVDGRSFSKFYCFALRGIDPLYSWGLFFRPQFLAKQIEQTSIGLFILVLVALAAIFLM